MVSVLVGVVMDIFVCVDCGAILTDEERKYYEYRCERCERQWCDRMQAWMDGAEDAELDACFDVPKPTVQ